MNLYESVRSNLKEEEDTVVTRLLKKKEELLAANPKMSMRHLNDKLEDYCYDTLGVLNNNIVKFIDEIAPINGIEIELYGDTKNFDSLKEALDYIEEAMAYCDPSSSECQRYSSIYQQLKSGKTICSDELNESALSNEAEKQIPENLKVVSCDSEDTGGHVIVLFGKLADGNYFALSSDLVQIFDDDFYYARFEDPKLDGDTYNWENRHRVAMYDYTDDEFKTIMKQCIKLDKSAESIADDDLLTEIGVNELYEEAEDEESLPDNWKRRHEFWKDEKSFKKLDDLLQKKVNSLPGGMPGSPEHKAREDVYDDIIYARQRWDRAKKSLNEAASTPTIVSVEPNYTGGNIYVYTGKLSDGNYFMAEDSDFDREDKSFMVLFVDEDPNTAIDPETGEELAWFWDEWQKPHLVKAFDFGSDEARAFTKQLLEWIIKNKPDGNYAVEDMEDMLEVINSNE